MSVANTHGKTLGELSRHRHVSDPPRSSKSTTHERSFIRAAPDLTSTPSVVLPTLPRANTEINNSTPQPFLNYIYIMTVTDFLQSQPKLLFIPDTMAAWPYKRVVNPSYDEAVAESRAWFSSYAHFTKQFDFHGEFELCDCGAF